MSQPFRTPFFSDTEFKNLKEILPLCASQPPALGEVSTYLEKVPQEDYEEAVNRIRLMVASMQKENLTPDDFKDSRSVVEIKLTTPIPGTSVEANSPQYQAICTGINEQLKQRIAQLQKENEDLKNRLSRQSEQFKQISILADQLINPQTQNRQLPGQPAPGQGVPAQGQPNAGQPQPQAQQAPQLQPAQQQMQQVINQQLQAQFQAAPATVKPDPNAPIPPPVQPPPPPHKGI